MIDGGYGFGNRRVLPAGPLREPLAPGLARADAVVLMGEDAAGIAPLLAGKTVLRARLEATNAGAVAGRKLVAFAGIGRPEKFFASLEAAGGHLVARHGFADHHRYGAAELARLRAEAAEAGALLVTTAKDRVRLPPADRAGIAVLEVAVAWENAAALDALLARAGAWLSGGCSISPRARARCCSMPAFASCRSTAASALGGFLARSIGPRLAQSRRALKTLRRALPEIDEAQGKRIIRGMWDNLGRVIAEYPHLAKYRAYERGGRIEMVGAEHIRAQGAPGRRAIFFSGHFGNWEVATLAVTQAGLDVVEIYRAANNPIVDQLIAHSRSVGGSELAAKGSAGGRRMLAAMKSGRHIAMLVDQKMNDGIAVPFFGRDAMTAHSLAVFALRFDCAVVPVRVDRLPRARFRITAEPPLPVTRSGDDAADARRLMLQVNAGAGALDPRAARPLVLATPALAGVKRLSAPLAASARWRARGRGAPGTS